MVSIMGIILLVCLTGRCRINDAVPAKGGYVAAIACPEAPRHLASFANIPLILRCAQRSEVWICEGLSGAV